MEQKKVRFSYVNRVPAETRVIADAEQIHRVISNIISNALKYMDKPEKHIDLRVLDNGDDIQVEIEDNGRGIAAKDLLHIVDRFYRTDASRHSGQGGSGIGCPSSARSWRITAGGSGRPAAKARAPRCVLF